MKRRRATVERKTRETQIQATLDLDGTGLCSIRTGMGFMDHMLELLGRHALWNLSLRARGDLAVDDHHTTEDIGLVLGEALDTALGDRRGIIRYGWCLLPMDETLVEAAVDLGGRPYLVYSTPHRRKIKAFDVGLIEEFFRAFVTKARMNLHVAVRYGRDPHHGFEGMFKAVARALRMAGSMDFREKDIPSSKGRL